MNSETSIQCMCR